MLYHACLNICLNMAKMKEASCPLLVFRQIFCFNTFQSFLEGIHDQNKSMQLTEVRQMMAKVEIMDV